MRHDMDHPRAHQRAETDRRAAVIRKDEEGAGIGDDAAMQGHAIHRRSHAMFTYAIVDVAPGPVGRGHRRGGGRFGIVGSGQVGRAADHFRHQVGDDFQRRAAPLARGLLLAALDDRLLVFDDRLGEVLRQAPGHGRIELALQGRVGQALFPRLAGLRVALADLLPGFLDGIRNLERFVRPTDILADAGNFFGAVGSAMRLAGAGNLRCAVSDDRLDGEEDRLFLLLRPFQRGFDVLRVMAVNLAGDPARGFEAGALVGRIGHIDVAVNGDRIVVPQHDQAVELHVAGQRDRFLADAFHETAIASDDVGLVVHEFVAEACIQVTLGHCHADSGRNALTQWAGRRLDTLCDEIFRMPRRVRAELAEIADVVAADRFVAGQVQQ